MEPNYNEEYLNYIYIDEVSRGNLAGPSIFCAVDLKVPYEELSFAVDSKTTKKKQRSEMINKIKENTEYFLVFIDNTKIDSDGLSKCIKDALNEIKEHFPDRQYLYDGNKTFGTTDIETLVKADAKVIGVSCASIIAKYTLDLKMEEFDSLYPQYGFLSNSGYGTKAHIEAIKKYGYCPIHRRSYNIKELSGLESKDQTDFLF